MFWVVVDRFIPSHTVNTKENFCMILEKGDEVGNDSRRSISNGTQLCMRGIRWVCVRNTLFHDNSFRGSILPPPTLLLEKLDEITGNLLLGSVCHS